VGAPRPPSDGPDGDEGAAQHAASDYARIVRGAVARRASPGEALLVACVQPGADTAPSDAVAELGREVRSEWTATMRSAQWHGVAPRLARSTVVNELTDVVPRDVDGQLQADYFATMARNLARRRELGRLADELRRHQIDVMVLKGAALVPLVHHDPGVRPMDDLDLLVHPDDLPHAEQVVQAAGYRSSDTTPATAQPDDDHHHLPSLVRDDGTFTVELHHKLGSSGSPPDFDVAGVWARALPFDAGDTTCLRPSDEDLLAHVGLHFLIDRVRLFSRRALRQVCDISAILAAFRDTLDWDRVIADADERGYAPALALALGTAIAVADAPLPDHVLAKLAPAPVVPDAAETVRRRVLRDPAWMVLERFTSRQPSVLHLLPPNPGRWSSAADAPPPTAGRMEGYEEWLAASSRILRHPAEVAAERRFAAQLQGLVFPRGLPDGSRSRRRLRRQVQARLAAR
jgi:hypothetical protein